MTHLTRRTFLLGTTAAGVAALHPFSARAQGGQAHLRILAAIEAGDPEAAEREMRDHLRTLTPFYEKLDRRVG